VFGLVEVLGGMPVFGRVTTTDVAAGFTEPQMNPGVAHFQAFLTTAGVGVRILDLVKVLTFVSHFVLV
jgi:hypothetical protein